MELSDGSGLSLVGTGVSNFWELRLPSPSSSSNGSGEGLLRPCYLLYCGDNGFSLWLPSLQCVTHPLPPPIHRQGPWS